MFGVSREPPLFLPRARTWLPYAAHEIFGKKKNERRKREHPLDEFSHAHDPAALTCHGIVRELDGTSKLR